MQGYNIRDDIELFNVLDKGFRILIVNRTVIYIMNGADFTWVQLFTNNRIEPYNETWHYTTRGDKQA